LRANTAAIQRRLRCEESVRWSEFVARKKLGELLGSLSPLVGEVMVVHCVGLFRVAQ
jgi:hypothetical protein